MYDYGEEEEGGRTSNAVQVSKTVSTEVTAEGGVETEAAGSVLASLEGRGGCQGSEEGFEKHGGKLYTDGA